MNSGLASRILVWLLVLLSLAGIADTLLISAATHLTEQVCSDEGSCDQVLASKYAKLFGISLWSLGFVFYLFLFATSLNYVASRTPRSIRLIRTASAVGVLFSIYFIYLQGVKIKAWCPLCLVSAGLQLSIFACSFILSRKKRALFKKHKPNTNGTECYVISAVCGVLILIGAHYLWKKVETKEDVSPVIAIVDGKEFRLESDENLLRLDYEMRSRVWDRYKSWFQEHLITLERNALDYPNRASFIDTEFAKEQKPITEEDLKKFYDNEYRSTAGERLPYEQTKEDIRSYLKDQAFFTFERDLLERLKTKYRASFELPRPAPPVVSLEIDPTIIPVLGNADAPIQIVQFADFACPYCRRLQIELRKVYDAYPDQVSIAYRHYYLPGHKYANEAAKASIAAWKQGKFWEYITVLYEKQGDGIEQDSTYVEVAEKLGLDMKTFQQDRTAPEAQEALERDQQEANRCHVAQPPTVFVNGHRMLENPVYENVVKKMRQLELIE